MVCTASLHISLVGLFDKFNSVMEYDHACGDVLPPSQPLRRDGRDDRGWAVAPSEHTTPEKSFKRNNVVNAVVKGSSGATESSTERGDKFTN